MPTFRSGGLHYLLVQSTGITLGNSIMSLNDDDAVETSTRELTHYYQQIHQGWARYFGRSLYE